MKSKSLRIILSVIICSFLIGSSINFSGIKNSKIDLSNTSNYKQYFVSDITNIINRFEIADLFEEEYLVIRERIILGSWNNDTGNFFTMLTPISHEEIIFILDKYASIKNLEIRKIDVDYDNQNLKSFNAINRLVTANIVSEYFLEEPLSIDVIENGIKRIDNLSQKKELIVKELNDIIKKENEKLGSKEQISFSMIHGQTGAKASYNGQVKNHPASIIKTLYLYVFLKEVEEGKRSLDDKRVFLKKDKYNGSGSRIGGSGILQSLNTNVTYTWGELLRLMIIHSDNVATSMVMRELGSNNIDKWSKILGLENTIITGPIYTAAGRTTRSTAEDLTEILYLLDTLPTEQKKYALKQMYDCKAKDRIAGNIESISWLGNKTGTLNDYVGDSAIIRYGDDENTIYMTLIIRTIDDSYIDIEKSEQLISDISHQIVNRMKSIDLMIKDK